VATSTTKQGFLNTFAKFAGAKMIGRKLTFPFHIAGTIDDPKFSNKD
jgi:hypothetical protein